MLEGNKKKLGCDYSATNFPAFSYVGVFAGFLFILSLQFNSTESLCLILGSIQSLPFYLVLFVSAPL